MNHEKLNSVDAASLLISDGATKDPALANHLASGGKPFDMDAMARAHLRRMMGFDFEMIHTEDKKMFTVYSKEGPTVELNAVYAGELDEAAIDILVETCLMVKMMWDKANAIDAKIEEGEVVETSDDTSN